METATKFCPKCGTMCTPDANPQDNRNFESAQDAYNPYIPYDGSAKENKSSKSPSKKKKPGLVIGIVCGIVLLCAGLGFGGWYLVNRFVKDANREKYKLTFEVSQGGTVITEPGEYPEGSTIELTAEADSGYVFVKWVRSDEEILENAENPTVNMKMPANDIIVTAVFISDFQSTATESDIYAYKVYNELELQYTDGDYADSVTKNIELCKECSEGEMTAAISWTSSNESIIDTDGLVNRPEGNDENVKLSATITVGTVKMTKEFQVKVIANSDFNYDETPNYNILEIEQLNDGDKSVDISYNDNMEYVESISGKFSEIKVNSEEAALQALCNVRGLLGINSPFDSLKWKATNYDDESLIYSFAQYWNDYRVYGFTVTVSANKNSGETNYLRSSLIPEEVLDTTDTDINYSIDTFKSVYSDIDFSSIETVVYALNDYADNPILAYYGVGVEENVIVSAIDGTELTRYSNIHSWGDFSTTGSGNDEKGDDRTFPVQFHQWDWWFYYLEDIERGIYIKGDNASALTHEFNTRWKDPTAISAYTNMIEVYDWYKQHLNRNSIDNNGMNVYVHVHDWGHDNACWSSDDNSMHFFDNRDYNDGDIPTTAAGLDILAHETTHGVVQYVLSGQGISDFPYADQTGAINEGYADVFGWLVDHDDYTIGEDWVTLRSISSPSDYNAPAVFSDYRIIENDDGSLNQSAMVHTNSSLVYHAAYLMELYGIKGSDLEKLWYKSLLLGYDASSDFFSVRRNLIQAGRNLGFDDEKICAIRKAFDDEEIYGERGSLTISFKDASGNTIPVSNLSELNIMVKGQEKCYPQNTYSNYNVSANQCGFADTYKGKYTVIISAEGYIPFTGEIEIFENHEAVLQVILIKDGEIEPVTGYITSATTGLAVEGVTISAVEGWNKQNGTIIATTKTDSDGMYSLNLDGGYYTLLLTKDEYTDGYLNIASATDYNGIYQNGSISPIIGNVSNYRVVLSWGKNPSDLDAHLTAEHDNSRVFHVFYITKSGYYNDEKIAELDVDDISSYGPETVTFTVTSELEYKYYIDWYSGSGTWASSDGKVEIYSGNNLLYVFNAPGQADRSGEWLVFSIKNGIFKIEDKIVE
ncbi:MAG: immunoglobulin-like domain-containing protein [Butyrivibrio sp.]